MHIKHGDEEFLNEGNVYSTINMGLLTFKLNYTLTKGRAPLLSLRCSCLALVASVSVNFWPSVVPLMCSLLLSGQLLTLW